MLSSVHFLGACLAIALIVSVSVYSGKMVKNSSDFNSGGNKANSMVVAGAIMGTLVGGSSTVGTAQLAYTYGMSAWWFTLGGGIACLILAIFYVVPLRKSGGKTIISILSNTYGTSVGIAATLLSSIGTFINIISQLISATAVIAIVFPNMHIIWSLAIAAVLMALYVIFGGVLGAGMVGVVKLILLYVSVITGGIIVLARSAGFASIYHALDHSTYFNVFARGFGTDAGAGVSLIIGVLSTQSYIQAILAGKNDHEAKKGALVSACMIPPIGIGGILIGMYMRIHHPTLTSAKMAFPQFVVEYMPPLLSGVVLATLLIAIIGTGAGLSLGISSIISNDVVKRITHRFDEPSSNLAFSRLMILIILFLACVFCVGPIGDTILGFAFMSMGLRGAVIFVPLCFALWIGPHVSRQWVMASVIVPPIIVLILELLDCVPFDPLFIGIAVSVFFCVIGRFLNG